MLIDQRSQGALPIKCAGCSGLGPLPRQEPINFGFQNWYLIYVGHDMRCYRGRRGWCLRLGLRCTTLGTENSQKTDGDQPTLGA